MKILILGGDGMLGHQLLRLLRERHEVRVTLRQEPQFYSGVKLFSAENSFSGVDLREPERLLAVLSSYHPEAVINAVGIVKQRADGLDVIPNLEINALLPHRLAQICAAIGARLIHISTDCVFSGNRGQYREDDVPDPVDIYGHSKLLGEVRRDGVVTLRTSIIGRSLYRSASLIDWFLQQNGRINGYTKAIFSGFTTRELSRVIAMLLERFPDASGLYHLSSSAISKHDLLAALRDRLARVVEIVPDDSVRIDRSLDSNLFRSRFSYVPPTWERMLDELRRRDWKGSMTLKDKRILVTGGTGSMGSTFVRRALSGEQGMPKKVIVFSRDEAKQHEMRMSYLHRAAATDEVIFNNFRNVLEFRIGDVRDYAAVCAAVRDADVVVNAAALKQVPTCEYFPEQAVLTNCFGPVNIVRAIAENRYPVESVVSISTDKACKPVNVMGMTKAIQERTFISANVLNPATRFVCVRYGNVLASRGSVIPLFLDQIANGGPLTLTVPAMTRFLLSLDQAVDTVFAALGGAKRGETYVPRAPSATVENIAKALIGGKGVATKVIGIRPGEKMHEIMVSEEEANHCVRRGEYFAILPMLPELRADAAAEPNALNAEFSSADTVLDLRGTTELLRKHKLITQ